MSITAEDHTLPGMLTRPKYGKNENETRNKFREQERDQQP